MIIKYYNRDNLCSIITVIGNDVSVVNYTDSLIYRAFGVNNSPTINDLDNFLASRCFPETRANVKDLLKGLGLDEYEPLEIVKITNGRMAEDYCWLTIEE